MRGGFPLNFEEMLLDYVGRSVEVFFANSFNTGILISVGSGIFTILTTDSTYQSPDEELTIFTQQVSFIRILV